jgi:hypothetical protein
MGDCCRLLSRVVATQSTDLLLVDDEIVLGLPDNAAWSEVRRAYRERVRMHHPDVGGDPRLFPCIQKAYQMLENRYM